MFAGMNPIQIIITGLDPTELSEARRVLQEYHIYHTLFAASNSAETIALLKTPALRGRPVLLLLSYQLPDGNAAELVIEIRALGLRESPRFYILFDESQLDREPYYHLDVSGFIFKPLRINNPAGIGALNLAIDLMSYRIMR